MQYSDGKNNSIFLNLGSMDGFNKDSMRNYLMEMTELPAKVFERINVKRTYSFIDIKGQYMQGVMDSFENELYKGRRIRVDDSGSRQKPRKSKSSSSRSKKGFYKKSSKNRYIR